MDISTPQSITGSTQLASAGGVFITPVYLYADPVENLEAVTKHYVDDKATFIPAGNVGGGLFDVSLFPAYSGDVVSDAGSGVLSLEPTGVAAGDYTKVIVNGKGLVTGGGSITPDDLPTLSWLKINKDHPTTLDGYQIVDGVRKSGDTVSGYVTLTVIPTDDLHAITKTYVDTLSDTGDSLDVGDVSRRAGTVAPTGYLVCDGSLKNISDYPELYAVIGSNYGAATETEFLIPDFRSHNLPGFSYCIKAKNY